MSEERKKKNRIARFFEDDNPTTKLVVGILTDFLSLLFLVLDAFLFSDNQKNKFIPIILFVVIAIFFIIHIRSLAVQLKEHKEYTSILLERSFSEGVLHALEHIEESKKRYILQSTYGNVPEWRPTDYTRNVLVYDVHEQIRTMLFSLRDLIISQTDGLTEDQITVDFVYCYPASADSKGYTGSLPYPIKENEVDSKEIITAANYPWRLITSGNHSLGGSIRSYLGRKNSFFYHVSKKGYVFCNDKRRLLYDHYAPSCKDEIYKNQGSIIGLMFELRNDAPESVFVKGILTITTYGKKLHDQHTIPLDEYKRIFKEKILNSFESALYSELVQMYIRHAIRDGDMCPKTGRHISSLQPNEANAGANTSSSSVNASGATPAKTKTCIWTQNVCKFQNNCCKGFCCQLPHGSVPNQSNP